jgi:hypothetical protein
MKKNPESALYPINSFISTIFDQKKARDMKMQRVGLVTTSNNNVTLYMLTNYKQRKNFTRVRDLAILSR